MTTLSTHINVSHDADINIAVWRSAARQSSRSASLALTFDGHTFGISVDGRRDLQGLAARIQQLADELDAGQHDSPDTRSGS